MARFGNKQLITAFALLAVILIALGASGLWAMHSGAPDTTATNRAYAVSPDTQPDYGNAALAPSPDKAEGYIWWLPIAAVASGVALLFLGGLLLLFPELTTQSETRDSPLPEQQNPPPGIEPAKDAGDAVKQDELFRTIQGIGQNLDQVVGQVRTRLNAMAPFSDDRGANPRKAPDPNSAQTEKQNKFSIH